MTSLGALRAPVLGLRDYFSRSGKNYKSDQPKKLFLNSGEPSPKGGRALVGGWVLALGGRWGVSRDQDSPAPGAPNGGQALKLLGQGNGFQMPSPRREAEACLGLGTGRRHRHAWGWALGGEGSGCHPGPGNPPRAAPAHPWGPHASKFLRRGYGSGEPSPRRDSFLGAGRWHWKASRVQRGGGGAVQDI